MMERLILVVIMIIKRSVEDLVNVMSFFNLEVQANCMRMINGVFCLGGFSSISDLLMTEKEKRDDCLMLISSMLNEMVDFRKAFFVTNLLEDFLISTAKAQFKIIEQFPTSYSENGDQNEYRSQFFRPKQIAVLNSTTSSDFNWEPSAHRDVECVNTVLDKESSRRRSNSAFEESFLVEISIL